MMASKGSAAEAAFSISKGVDSIWENTILEFEKSFVPEDHASPFLSFVDIVMVRCKEKDESESKMFEYIDYINQRLRGEDKGRKIAKILIEDGLDFYETE